MRQPSQSTKTVTMSYEEYHDDLEREEAGGRKHVVDVIKKLNAALPEMIKKDLESPRKDPSREAPYEGEYDLDSGIWETLGEDFDLQNEISRLMVHGFNYITERNALIAKAKKSKKEPKQLEMGADNGK